MGIHKSTGNGGDQLWYRIVPMPAPWIASGNSFNGKPQAFYGAILLQRFNSILRAGRRISALIAQPGRNDQLIQFYQAYKWETCDSSNLP